MDGIAFQPQSKIACREALALPVPMSLPCCRFHISRTRRQPREADGSTRLISRRATQATSDTVLAMLVVCRWTGRMCTRSKLCYRIQCLVSAFSSYNNRATIDNPDSCSVPVQSINNNPGPRSRFSVHSILSRRRVQLHHHHGS